MSSKEYFSPDPAEVTTSYVGLEPVQDSDTLHLILMPNTLAAGEEPKPGVSYTPRITKPAEFTHYDGSDEPDAPMVLIGVLPAPVPPTPQRLIRS